MSEIDDVAAIIRAGLDEDERLAREFGEGKIPMHWHLDEAIGDTVLMWPPEFHTGYKEDQEWRGEQMTWAEIAAHVARHDPARVLEEVASKRDMLDALLAEPHAGDCRTRTPNPDACDCAWDERVLGYLRRLARPYREQQC